MRYSRISILRELMISDTETVSQKADKFNALLFRHCFRLWDPVQFPFPIPIHVSFL